MVNPTNTKTIEDELTSVFRRKRILQRANGLEEAHNELRENYFKLLLEYNKLKEIYKKVLGNMTR